MTVNDEQRAAIADMRASRKPTRRAVVAAVEDILYEPLPVLDHGFVRVIDYMGDDAAIVQAARVSYGRGTKKVSSDHGLIAYLMRNRHTSPFEMCEIKLHVKLPIFVARQWIRHRTANVNEYSARYSVLDDDFYIPDREHLAAQSASNRQGRGTVIEGPAADAILRTLRTNAERSYEHYMEMLNEDENGMPQDPRRPGLARELARMALPLNTYSEWYWKIDLHNLLHFVALRADAHAQYEIRAYADVLNSILARWVPLTFDAFKEHRLSATEFSATALAVLRRMLAGETVTQEDSGLNASQWRELLERLEPQS